MTFLLPSASSDLKVPSMNSNGPGRQKSFTSCLQHGWLRGFGALNSSPNSWIFTSASMVSAPPSYLFTVFTLHQSMAQNLSDMWLSTFVIDAAQLCSVPEIATKSASVSCVWTKAIQYSANSLKLAWPNVVARHTHVVNTVDIFKIFVTFIPSHRDIARSGLSARSVRMERNEERLLSLSPFVDVWLATEVKEICKIVTVIININSWRPLVSSLGWA